MPDKIHEEDTEQRLCKLELKYNNDINELKKLALTVIGDYSKMQDHIIKLQQVILTLQDNSLHVNTSINNINRILVFNRIKSLYNIGCGDFYDYRIDCVNKYLNYHSNNYDMLLLWDDKTLSSDYVEFLSKQ